MTLNCICRLSLLPGLLIYELNRSVRKSYNKTETTPISRPPNFNTQQTRERGEHNKQNSTLPAKYADFIVNIPERRVEKTNKNMGMVLHSKLSPLHPELSLGKLGKGKKETSGEGLAILVQAACT